MNNLRLLLCFLVCQLPAFLFAQVLTLEEVQEASHKNYPLIKQRSLLQQSGQYSLQNISTSAWPQLTINGQATYQSDVTRLSINMPNVSTPELSKDQYRIYAEAVQPLTDLITVSRQKAVQVAGNDLAASALESELYKVTERVNNIYFGILLLDEQQKQNELTKADIRTGIDKVSAAVKNGTDYRSNLDKLKAQLLIAEQRDIDLKAMRKAYAGMLSLFIGHSVPDTVSLVSPVSATSAMDIHRPELQVFESQRQSYDAQSRLVRAKSLPRFSLFAQGGYGKPGLNMLDNEFKGYYIGGLRLNWSLSSLYTVKKEQRILSISKDMVAAQQETFLLNTSLLLRQQSEDIVRLQQSLQTDGEIIALRSSIKQAAAAQLENGVITVNEYLREVTNEALAREQSSLHQVQLLQAQYNIKTTSGN